MLGHQGLASGVEEPLHQFLGRRLRHQPVEHPGLEEQAGLDVRARRQHCFLRTPHSSGIERRDAASQFVDVGIEQFGSDRPVEVPPGGSGLGIEIQPAEDQFRRPVGPDEMWKALGSPRPGDDADRDLHLVHHGSAPGCEPHVEAHGDLAAPSAEPSGDFADRRLRHGAEAFDHLIECAQFGRRFGRLARCSLQQCDVEVGDEKVWDGALENDDGGVGLSFDALGELQQVDEQLTGDEVDRRLSIVAQTARPSTAIVRWW